MIPGVLADIVGWRAAFLVLAAIGLAGAVVVAVLLPRERRFVRSAGFGASGLQMLRHLRNPQLVATYAVGFGVLFIFIALFTYVSFLLAAPPYDFSPAALGALFLTYLIGTLAAPLTGRAVLRFGRRGFMLGVIAVWMIGVLLLVATPDQRDRARAVAVRRLRDAEPGDLHRLCDGERARRALIRDRTLCEQLLYRGQCRRLCGGHRLEPCRLAGRGRALHRRAGRHGDHRRSGVDIAAGA